METRLVGLQDNSLRMLVDRASANGTGSFPLLKMEQEEKRSGWRLGASQCEGGIKGRGGGTLFEGKPALEGRDVKRAVDGDGRRGRRSNDHWGRA